MSLNPFEPGFFDNPYDQYARLREADPVHQTPFGAWFLTCYDDVLSVLRDPRFSVDEHHASFDRRARVFAAGDPRKRRGERAMLNLDPPDHTRLRRLVSKAFTPRQVEQLAPRIQAIVDGLLAGLDPTEPVDVIAALAFPLPFAVISELLGMPETDHVMLRDVSHTLVKTLEPLVLPDELPAVAEASDRMTEHVEAAIAWKRSHPADDLLSALIAVQEAGDGLSPGELVDQVVLLYLAGHETTVNLIGNGTAALLRHRDQLELLQHERDLVPNAVEELARFDSPVQLTRRIAVTDLAYEGNTITAGSFVFLCLAAANRDPAHFGADAENLDLRRSLAPQHLAFGAGIHHCLGSALARVEAQIALETLVSRYPSIELATDHLRWNGRMVLRGLDELPVVLGRPR